MYVCYDCLFWFYENLVIRSGEKILSYRYIYTHTWSLTHINTHIHSCTTFKTLGWLKASKRSFSLSNTHTQTHKHSHQQSHYIQITRGQKTLCLSLYPSHKHTYTYTNSLTLTENTDTNAHTSRATTFKSLGWRKASTSSLSLSPSHKHTHTSSSTLTQTLTQAEPLHSNHWDGARPAQAQATPQGQQQQHPGRNSEKYSRTNTRVSGFEHNRVPRYAGYIRVPGYVCV